MMKIFIFMISMAMPISLTVMAVEAHSAHKSNKHKKTHNSSLIKHLFEKTDLSRFDRDIDSVMDKDHVSLNEFELLKTQALLEALEVNSYDKAIIDELLPHDGHFRRSQDQIPVKSFNQRLNSLPIEEKIKTELSSIALSLKELISKVKEGFASFKKSGEMSGFENENDKIPFSNDVGNEKNLDDYIKSQEFKNLQTSTKDVMKRFNEAVKRSIIEE